MSNMFVLHCLELNRRNLNLNLNLKHLIFFHQCNADRDMAPAAFVLEWQSVSGGRVKFLARGNEDAEDKEHNCLKCQCFYKFKNI